MLQGFNDDDLYLIDMSYLNSPAELVYDLTSVLENEQAKNKRIKIKIGGIDLNQAQLMSIKSLILSVNSSLAVLDGTSEITRTSALASGIVYENSADMIPAETIFWHKTQNNEAENQQENEISCENQTETEQKSEQKELAVEDNYPENEVNYQSYLLWSFNTENERQNFINYCKSKFARFCLSLRKVGSHLDRTEILYVPWLDFTQEWNDAKLCKEFGISEELWKYIDNFIPDYYDDYKAVRSETPDE